MSKQKHYIPLKLPFYHQPTLELAKNLLGKMLVHETNEGLVSGMIVETEAYLGEIDQAAHSYRGKRTKRTETMYHSPGHIYIYQMHTHHLFNIVSGEINNPQAILVRAVEPEVGLNIMASNRPGRKSLELTNGPGKLSKALNITMANYGQTVFSPPLYIASGYNNFSIAIGKRIGIDNSGDAKDAPYRFWIKDNPFVSRK